MSQRIKMRARTMSLRAIGVHEGDDLDMRTVQVSRSNVGRIGFRCKGPAWNGWLTDPIAAWHRHVLF